MSTPLLQTIELKKYFPVPDGFLHAVDGVNLSIARGETMGIVGESGCGKSTLGRALLHLLPATDGQILFDGQDITRPHKSMLKGLRDEMQMIFQDPFSSLNPRMSIGEIIAEPLVIRKRYKDRAALEQKVFDAMETVGLAERFANVYPHELDGGRRQRIGIARALVLEPRFLVCDEPVSALDVSIQAQILNLMQDLQEQFGLTYLFITHDLSVVRHISTHITVMYLGKTVEQAPAEQLFANPTHPYTRALLSAIPIPSTEPRPPRILLRGEISSPVNPKPGCRFAPRCNEAQPICSTEDPVWRPCGGTGDHFVACHLV